jgi:hypothetical protein
MKNALMFVLSLSLIAGAAAHSATADTDSAAAETVRVRAHLTAVEAELRAADVSAFTAAQRAARARNLDVLREYREAGVFPHNHVLPDARTPVFVDEHGTHCAVGYLLARDGRHDLITRVRTHRNTATVHELASEPELVTWLEQAGLTLDEAARIQPTYGPREQSDASYATVSMVGAAVGGGAIAWNLLLDDKDARTLPGVIGIGVGVAELGLAVTGAMARGYGNDDVEVSHVLLNAGIGVVSGLLGVRTLLTGARTEQLGVGSGPAPRRQAEWQISPWLRANDAGVGMRLNVQF